MIAAGAGSAERELDQVLSRFALQTRAVLLLLYSALVVLSAPAEHLWRAAGIALLTACWAVALLSRLRAPVPVWTAFAVDAVMIVVLCLSPMWSGLPDAIGWVLAVGGLTAIAAQYSWGSHPACGIALAGISALAYVGGNALLGHLVPALLLGLRMFAEGVLAHLSYRLLRSYARTADRLIERVAARRQEVEVARARRRAEREYLATLHDTAAATLLMIATSGGRSPQRVAERAQQDLDAVNAAPQPVAGRIDLVPLVRSAVQRHGLRVRQRLPASADLPAAVAIAIGKGLGEALSNITRHAGVEAAELRVTADESGGVEAELIDRGAGFDTAHVREGARGITESITARMAEAGGAAEVRSAPGRGTVVRWRWRPAADDAQPSREQSAGRQIRVRLVRGMRLALLLIALLVQFCFCAAQLAGYADVYRSLAAEVVAFCLLLAVGAGEGWTALRGGPPRRWWRAAAITAVGAAAVLGTAAVPPEHVLRTAHWSFGLVGWYGVVLLFDRPPRQLLCFFAGCAVVTSVPLLVAGPSREVLAMMITLSLSVYGYQLAVGLLGQRLHSIAAAAERAAAAAEELRTCEAVAETIHQDHRARCAELRGTTVPLLAELAAGELDPADPAVRRRCAREAARVRRLLVAQHDEHPDQLLHDLRACADALQRSGVLVEFSVRGAAPELVREVRHAIADPVIAVLAQVRGWARVTVLCREDEVRVGVVGDAPESAAVRSDSPEVHISTLARGEALWVSATTRAVTRSRSH